MREAPAAPTPRNVNVDQIGYVKELEKHHAADLITDVKARMMEREQTRVTGDFFEGLLVKGEQKSIDADLFLGMFECGTLTREQFLSCIAVRNEPAAKCLSGDQITAMSRKSPIPAALRVTRITSVELKLVQCLEKLGGSIKR